MSCFMKVKPYLSHIYHSERELPNGGMSNLGKQSRTRVSFPPEPSQQPQSLPLTQPSQIPYNLDSPNIKPSSNEVFSETPILKGGESTTQQMQNQNSQHNFEIHNEQGNSYTILEPSISIIDMMMILIDWLLYGRGFELALAIRYLTLFLIIVLLQVFGPFLRIL